MTRAIVAVVSGAVVVSLIDIALGTGITGLACFTVLEPGDTIVVFSFGADSNFHISGAELAGVAP